MPGIDFDSIIKCNVSRNYVIGMFNRKQNNKIQSPQRYALHNMTIMNIHKLYDYARICKIKNLQEEQSNVSYSYMSESPYLTYTPITLENILSKDENELEEYIPAFLYDE